MAARMDRWTYFGTKLIYPFSNEKKTGIITQYAKGKWKVRYMYTLSWNFQFPGSCLAGNLYLLSIYVIAITFLPLLSTHFRLLIIFANSLDPDQARQKVGPDLDPICLTLRWYS